MHRPDLEPVPERFDIHVMAFADDSPAAVEALASVFRIERAEAKRLIADAPVVVKRAAPPEVADALLDVLGKLGAQVVLLPSRGTPAEPAQESGPPARPPGAQESRPLPAAKASAPSWGEPEPAERDFFLAERTASDPAPPPPRDRGVAWGGLDLGSLHGELEPARAPRALLDQDEIVTPPQPAEPATRSWARPARSVPYASFAPPSSPEHVAPRAELEEEPEPSSQLNEPQEESWDAEQAPAVVDPAPILDRTTTPSVPSLELAVPLPVRRLVPADPPPPPPPTARGRAAPDGVPLGAKGGVRAPGPDLGLGLVPPLPALGSLPPLPPPSALAPRGTAARTAAAGAPAIKVPVAPLLSERPRAAPRGAAPGASAPRTGGTAKLELPRLAGTPAAAPSLPQAAWMTRAEVPAAPDAPRVPAVSATGAQGAAPSPAGAPTPSPIDLRPRTAAASPADLGAARASRKSRAFALLELVGGAGVIAAGLQLDHSILHGTADTLWLLLHTLALYGIGSGVYGLRP